MRRLRVLGQGSQQGGWRHEDEALRTIYSVTGSTQPLVEFYYY
jgi:hypothetical protein